MDFLSVMRNESTFGQHKKKSRKQERSIDSLKRNSSSLHRKKMNIGNPAMTDDVQIEKHIRYKRQDMADLGEGGDANAKDFLDAIDGTVYAKFSESNDE